MSNTKITSNVISDDIALGGNPTTTTQSAGNDTTRIATTAFVKAAIDATIDSAPGALDTLNELAAAIGDDANFSTTITNSIATKLPLAGGTLTGALTGTTGAFVKASSGGSATSNTVLTIEDDDNTEISILGGSSSVLAINFGHSGDNDEGKITFNTTAGSEDLQIVSSKLITLDGSYVTVQGQASYAQIALVGNDGVADGYVYAESGDVGFLDDDGHWAYKHDTDTSHQFLINNDVKMHINSDGNVGIAKSSITTWSSGYKSLQIGGRGYIGAHSGSDLYVGQNAYYNSGWKYEASVAASLTQHSGGQITHKVAAAGTAGNAISWINAIHIKPTGEVGIQTTAPQAKLSVNTPLTQASADLRAIDIVVPGSWSLSGNAGHTSDITWTNAEAAGYVMGKFGLRYAGTATNGNSEFVFKDMYHGGYGASVDAMYVGSNGIVMHPNQPYFEVYRSGNETGFNASNSYAQVVVYNSATTNIGGHYNTSTGYFTAPVAGVYSFVAAAYTNFTCGQAWFSSTGGRLGGTDMVLNGMGNFPAAWITIRMAANDTIGFHPYASGTTSGTINANGNHTYFRGALIG